MNIKKYFTSDKMIIISGYVGLFLITAGISWAAFAYLGGDSKLSQDLSGLAAARSKIDENLPKTEECPINGGYFTEIEREIWESRRPLTAIIENHKDSRPLEGLSRADIVYEAIAESGVTRNLGVFYCAVASDNYRLAPIRSARVHFINWAAGYGTDPIFMHIGGANNFCPNCPDGVKPKGEIDPRVDAYALLNQLGWAAGRSGNDLDIERNVGYPVGQRDTSRLKEFLGEDESLAAEHTVVAFSDEVFKEASSRGFGYKYDGDEWTDNFTSWKFQDDNPVSTPDATEISFEFWPNEPDYEVTWLYDAQTNSYKRENGGEPAIDLSSNKRQIVAKNIAVIFVTEKTGIDREHHVFYDNLGSGEAVIFQNGTATKGTWEKETITDRILFADEGGREIEFVRGAIWIEALPLGNDIVYN